MGDIVEAVLQKLFPWMLDPMGKALQGMMVGAFSSTAGSVSYAEWNVAITAANRIGWVMGFVNMLICAVGAVHAAVKASPAESVKSFAMAVLAWPLTAICVSVMITCEGIVSLLSARILAVGADTTKGRGMESMVSAMFKKILEQASVLHSLTMLLVYLVLFVGVFLLCCMLAARTLCLVLLAAVAPLPVMSAGWKATRPAMRRWLSAVVGVMLAKPLAALVITVGSALVTAAQLTRQVVTAAAGVATGGAAAAGVQLPGMAQGGLAALTGQWGQVGEQAGKMLAGSKSDGKDKDDGGGARDSGAHAADPSKDDGYEPPVSAPPDPDGSAIPAPDGASPAGTAPGGEGGDGGRGVAGRDGSDGADGIGGEGGLGGAGGEGRTGSSGAPGSPGDPGPAGMPGPDAAPAAPVSPQSPSGPVLA